MQGYGMRGAVDEVDAAAAVDAVAEEAGNVDLDGVVAVRGACAERSCTAGGSFRPPSS